MSLYPNKIQVDGVPCGLILRGSANGTYLAVFEREMAELARIEQIDWIPPRRCGGKPAARRVWLFRSGTSGTPTLPAATRCFSRQRSSIWGYGRLPGPVGGAGGYSSEKQALLQEQESMIAALEQAGSAAQLRSELEDAYQKGVELCG